MASNTETRMEEDILLNPGEESDIETPLPTTQVAEPAIP